MKDTPKMIQNTSILDQRVEKVANIVPQLRFSTILTPLYLVLIILVIFMSLHTKWSQQE